VAAFAGGADRRSVLLCVGELQLTAKCSRSSISSKAVTRSALVLPIRTDALGALVMSQAAIVLWHVLRISIVLNALSSE
jgi:hypothetical protein